MRIYNTKYALTDGIKEIEVNKENIEDDGYVFVNKDGLSYFLRKNEWAKTKEEALKAAEEMRNKKISSLQKKIKKLEKMEIKVILLDE